MITDIQMPERYYDLFRDSMNVAGIPHRIEREGKDVLVNLYMGPNPTATMKEIRSTAMGIYIAVQVCMDTLSEEKTNV